METIILYHKSDFTTPIFAVRDEVYTHRNTLYDEHYIAVVDVFIFDITGKLFMQKRAMHKKISPGLLHTSVGGHVNAGEPIEYTLMHETIEEFGYPPILIPDTIDWGEALEKFMPYLNRGVLLKKIFTGPIEFRNIDENMSYDVFNDFVGVFAGIPENLDNSAECFVLKTLEEMDELIVGGSGTITRSFMRHYEIHRDQLYEFRKMLMNVPIL